MNTKYAELFRIDSNGWYLSPRPPAFMAEKSVWKILTTTLSEILRVNYVIAVRTNSAENVNLKSSFFFFFLSPVVVH
jgi:hypothetical protein